MYFLFWSKADKFKIDKNLQAKQRKKLREYCHSSQRNYQKKAKKKEILPTFQRCMDEEDEHSQS